MKGGSPPKSEYWLHLCELLRTTLRLGGGKFMSGEHLILLWSTPSLAGGVRFLGSREKGCRGGGCNTSSTPHSAAWTESTWLLFPPSLVAEGTIWSIICILFIICIIVAPRDSNQDWGPVVLNAVHANSKGQSLHWRAGSLTRWDKWNTIILILHMKNGGERNYVTCPRSHRKSEVEQGTESVSPESQYCVLTTKTSFLSLIHRVKQALQHNV